MGGIYVMITEEENDLLTEFFVDNEYVNESQLTDRGGIIADKLVHKGVLVPTLRGYRVN